MLIAKAVIKPDISDPRGDLLKSVPWSKSELFLVFRPSATQIVFFVRVLIPQ